VISGKNTMQGTVESLESFSGEGEKMGLWGQEGKKNARSRLKPGVTDDFGYHGGTGKRRLKWHLRRCKKDFGLPRDDGRTFF